MIFLQLLTCTDIRLKRTYEESASPSLTMFTVTLRSSQLLKYKLHPQLFKTACATCPQLFKTASATFPKTASATFLTTKKLCVFKLLSATFQKLHPQLFKNCMRNLSATFQKPHPHPKTASATFSIENRAGKRPQGKRSKRVLLIGWLAGLLVGWLG